MSDIAFSVIVNNNGIDDIVFKTIMLKGDKGNSVDHIEKTSTSGLVDTYTIYLTDGTIGGTFTVTNGSPVNIDDTVTAIDKTWSSSKLSGMIKSIDDNVVNADKLWSSQKINSMLAQTGTIEDVAIASFSDGADDVPLSELIVDIDAWQEGSGEPSPDNERAIHGWSECNIIKSGINLCENNLAYGNIDNSGADYGNDQRYIRTSTYNRVKGGETYCFYANSDETFSQIYCIEYDSNKSCIKRTSVNLPSGSLYTKYGSFQLDEKTCFVRCFIYSGTAFTNLDNKQIAVNYPATDTSYHAHDGGTDTIDFTDTVYGGKLNVATGLLALTHVGVVYDGSNDENWGLQSINSNNIANFYIKLNKAWTDAPLSLCDRFSIQTTLISATTTEGYLLSVPDTLYLRVNSSRASTTTELKNWLASNNTKLVYKLSTPETIQLTPTEVRTLLNANNIYADTGNVDKIVYFKTGSEPVARMIEAYMRAQPEE